MQEIVYVESVSDDEDHVKSNPEDGPNKRNRVSTREVMKIKDTNQSIVATFVDKEKTTLEETEALKECKDYWKDIAETRLQNLNTMNVALESQAKRIDVVEEKNSVSTRDVTENKDSNQLIVARKIKHSDQLIVANFVDKENTTLEDIEALRKCKDYWKEIAEIRLQNLNTVNVALESQAKRIYELETSISDAKAEELKAKKARFSTCKPQLGSSTSTQYGIMVHSIPTTMKLASAEAIRSFQEENDGLLDSLLSIKWINERNLEGKRNSSIVIYLSDSNDYERLLKQGSVQYGHQYKQLDRFVANLQVGKSKCFKCDGMGHFARDCTQFDGKIDLFERLMKAVIETDFQI